MTSLPESPDWRLLRSVAGGSDFVPSAVDRMVHALNAEDASSAYWELDNRVVVQGQLFEAAVWTARAVSVAICSGEPSVFGLRRALDLLVEIAAGEPHESEVALGNTELGVACHRELRQHLPCFRRLALSQDDCILLGMLDLLDVLEVERGRLREIANNILHMGTSSVVEERARELAGGD